jgi:hypothetical protein
MTSGPHTRPGSGYARKSARSTSSSIPAGLDGRTEVGVPPGGRDTTTERPGPGAGDGHPFEGFAVVGRPDPPGPGPEVADHLVGDGDPAGPEVPVVPEVGSAAGQCPQELGGGQRGLALQADHGHRQAAGRRRHRRVLTHPDHGSGGQAPALRLHRRQRQRGGPRQRPTVPACSRYWPPGWTRSTRPSAGPSRRRPRSASPPTTAVAGPPGPWRPTWPTSGPAPAWVLLPTRMLDPELRATDELTLCRARVNAGPPPGEEVPARPGYRTSWLGTTDTGNGSSAW